MRCLRDLFCSKSDSRDEESDFEKKFTHTPLLLEHQPCPEARCFEPTTDGWNIFRSSHRGSLPHFPHHCHIPSSFRRIYENYAVMKFAKENIQKWHEKVPVDLSCGPGLPLVSVNAYRFEPHGLALQSQIHHKVAKPETTKALLFGFRIPSDSAKFASLSRAWIDRVANSNVETFCKQYVETGDNLAIHLFKIAAGLRAETMEGIQLMKYVWLFLTVTYMLGHTISIYNVDNKAVKGIRGSRLLGRQAKSILVPLQDNFLACVLDSLEQVSSTQNGKDRVVVFFCVILICMAFEDQQKTLLVVLDNHKTEMTEGCLQEPRKEFLADWQRVDELAGSVIQFFLRSLQGAPSKGLESFAYLVDGNYESLKRKRDMIVDRENMGESTLRLVSRLLLQVFEQHPTRKIDWLFRMKITVMVAATATTYIVMSWTLITAYIGETKQSELGRWILERMLIWVYLPVGILWTLSFVWRYFIR